MTYDSGSKFDERAGLKDTSNRRGSHVTGAIGIALTIVSLRAQGALARTPRPSISKAKSNLFGALFQIDGSQAT